MNGLLRFETLPLTRRFIGDLRSDHAGECGAVAIYVGILAVTGSAEVRNFALTHLRAELKHRRFFDQWLPRRHHSRLLPLWRAAGWTLGACAALCGQRGVYRTIAAVERFVEQHYSEQIEALSAHAELEPLRVRLQQFCADEVAHYHVASQQFTGPGSWIARVWCRVVGVGSAWGVAIARRI